MIEELISDNIDIHTLEALLERKRADMAKKDILKDYPIKQLPDGRYWIRIDGRQLFRRNKQDLENQIIELKTQRTLVRIFDEYLEQRKLEVVPNTWALDIKYFDWYIKNSKLGNKELKSIKMSDGYKFFEYVYKLKKGQIIINVYASGLFSTGLITIWRMNTHRQYDEFFY